MEVVVVGAGIVGACMAYALSQRGAKVTVIDAGYPAAGATGRSFGWINASFYENAAHFALRAAGIASYRRLERSLNLELLNWAGCICWEEEGAAFDSQATDLCDLGYDVAELDAIQFMLKEPHVAAPKRALFFAGEAAVDPVALTTILLAKSCARVISGCCVDKIETQNGTVTGVKITGGTVPADRIVIASGVGSAGLLAPLGIKLPLLDRPGLILRTRPVKAILSHVLVAPNQEFRQLPSGHIIAPTVAGHQSDETEIIHARPDLLADLALKRLNKLMPDIEIELEEVSLAQRPVPKDGLPVVGGCGPVGLFTAVMHSGVTLAPVVAEILSQEVVGQTLSSTHADLISTFRPDRFQSGLA